MAAKFGIVITYTRKGTAYTMVLDNVSDNSVSSRSTLTTYPTVNGDMIGDHMYKEPATISFSGSISLDGNTGYSNRVNNAKSSSYYGTSLSLKGIEDWFKSIQDEAILCDIVKTSLDGNVFLGFRKLSQCVLTSCTWTEKVNSLDYAMEFTQVMVAEVKETQTQSVTSDEYLPDITTALPSSFVEEYIDWSQLLALILQKLYSDYMITEEFAENYINTGTDALDGLINTSLKLMLAGYGLAGGTLLGAILPAVGAGVSVGPVGWIILGAGLLIGVVSQGVYAVSKEIKKYKTQKAYAIEQFQYFKSDVKRAKEVERFNQYVSNIMKYVYTLDDAIQIYKISENIPQNLILNIDNKYYSFNFVKDNVSDEWVFDVTRPDMEDKEIKTNLSTLCAARSYLGSNDENRILVTANEGRNVYLIFNYTPPTTENGEIDESNIEEALYEQERDLRNYWIVVSSIKAQDFSKTLSDLIYGQMKKYDG